MSHSAEKPARTLPAPAAEMQGGLEQLEQGLASVGDRSDVQLHEYEDLEGGLLHSSNAPRTPPAAPLGWLPLQPAPYTSPALLVSARFAVR